MRRLFRSSMASLAGSWARRRVAKIDPGRPERTLRYLLERAKNTRYGRDYGFAQLLSARDLYGAFKNRVPVIDYGDWVSWLGGRMVPTQPKSPQPLIDQAWPGKIHMFCLSSGTTTGRTKYIPYSAEMATVNRKAAFDFFATYLAEIPDLAPLLSRTLYLSGSTNLGRSETGVIAGDMSGLTKYLVPKLFDRLVLPPRHISSIQPWQKRLSALLEVCQKNSDIGVISGIPIWQLTLLEAVQSASQRPIAEVMPNLRYIIHGGMSIAPYREKLSAILEPKVTFLEVYAASEAGIAAFQFPGEKGMRFFQGYDVFFEFEDESGQITMSHQIQPHRSYRLLISSCSGLWRYRIGDCLVFLKTDPLTLSHVSRDKTTSTFDEKITEREIEDAMMSMVRPVADFSMGPDIDGRRHVWFLIGPGSVTSEWMQQLDGRLRAGNQDYDDYRGDGRIHPPTHLWVSDRAEFLELLGREEGGQRKFPRLLSPTEVTRAFEKYRQVGD